MPVFAYKAYERGGAVTNGLLTADTAAVGREMLRRRGLRPMEFEPARAEPRRWFAGSMRRGHRRKLVDEFVRQLAMLLRSGVPIVEALDVLIRQSPAGIGALLRDLRDRVASGSELSRALEQHQHWFDPVFLAAVRVGEMSGHLDQSLQGISEFMRDRQQLRQKVIAAVTYPIILAVVGIGVVLFLMTYVTPQLLTVLEGAGRALPRSTQALKWGSDFLTVNWWLLLSAGLVYATGATALWTWPTARRCIQRLLFAAPVLGAVLRKTIVAQFAQMLHLLLRSGVPFVDSIRLMGQSASNLVLRDELAQVEADVRRGSDIAPTLAHSCIFPPLVAHLIHVGQSSGELGAMLEQLKIGYETEVRVAVGLFTSVLEPALIVFLSIAVGFIVFGTMMPILEAGRVLQ